MSNSTSPTEDRALKLLGSNLSADTVAAATGVTPARISQLLSDPEFAAKVAELRFQTLAKHNDRDERYDTLEDTLLARMKDLLPMMFKPMEVLAAIRVINAAKRRGASAPNEIHNQTAIVNVILPTIVVRKFTTNSNNQVISAGDQDLITVQSSQMSQLVSARNTAQAELIGNAISNTE